MPELAYLNGKIMPIEEARVPIEDRGYQFSDAVYEYFASYKGRLFAVKEHLDRLENSLRALAFPPIPRELLRDAVLSTFQKAGIERAGVYMQISRGVAPRNHPFPKEAKPQIVITVRQVADTPKEYLEKGIAAITVTDIRWGRCDIKTVQLLPNVLAKQQAIEAGVQDAIFVSPEGIVREGTASNLFIYSNGRLQTHPLSPHILPGITRAVLIDICRKIRVDVEELFFDNNAMVAAEEVFLTGTVTEVLSVCRIDGQTIGAGKPGPMAARLRKELEARAGAHLK
ncbi:MAG: D-amino acid aminotransferase [Desulfobacterales bacterium]|nr:D-amino acid aminotransferase [Desulfobacterales bacterium]